MRKFSVKSLSVTGKGKKKYTTGMIVTEDMFPRHNIDWLVSSGNLVEIIEECQQDTQPDPEQPVPGNEPPAPTPPGDPSGDPDGPVEDTPNEDEPVDDKVSEPSAENAVDVSRETEKEESEKEETAQVGIAQIKKELKERGIKFEKNAPYADLYKLWIGG